MIYVTGDCDGKSRFDKIFEFCDRVETNRDEDVMIILGDHTLNYYGEKESRRIKRMVSSLPLTFVLIHGNHDRRPSPAFHYERAVDTEHIGGVFYTEEEFPTLLHAIDGNTYRFDEHRCFVMGGAFSVDGEYRRKRYLMGEHSALWFEDEQLSSEELDRCYHTLNTIKSESDSPLTILTHTCPFRFMPTEAFLTGIDQSKVDKTMEHSFDEMFNLLGKDDRWLCGHYHIDKPDGQIRFLYNDIIAL